MKAVTNMSNSIGGARELLATGATSLEGAWRLLTTGAAVLEGSERVLKCREKCAGGS